MANLAGEPALSLPTYLSAANLPLGIQLQGAKGSDQTLLAVGKLFEDHHQFKLLDQQVSSDAEQPVTSEEHGAEPQTPATPADQTVPDAKQAQAQAKPSQPAAEQPGTALDEPQITTPMDQPAITGEKQVVTRCQPARQARSPKQANQLITSRPSQLANNRPRLSRISRQAQFACHKPGTGSVSWPWPWGALVSSRSLVTAGCAGDFAPNLS